MIWHLAYDIVQVVPRIDIMVPACCQQRADDGHVLRCLMVTAEEVVLPAQRDGTYHITANIFIKKESSVI